MEEILFCVVLFSLHLRANPSNKFNTSFGEKLQVTVSFFEDISGKL
jgi:hypothetical protein